MAAEIARYRRYAAYQLGYITAIDLQPWQSQSPLQWQHPIYILPTPNAVWQYMTRLPKESLLSSVVISSNGAGHES